MIPVKILAVRYLQNAALSSALGTEKKCLAMVTTDCDDATYIALDEATKAAGVRHFQKCGKQQGQHGTQCVNECD